MSDSEEETATDHQLKFVLLGDGASGKVFVIVSHKVKLFLDEWSFVYNCTERYHHHLSLHFDVFYKSVLMHDFWFVLRHPYV